MSMTLETELLDIIHEKYPDGIRLDRATKMMLEGLIGGEKISEEEIDKLRKSMFTNDDGLSFFMDSIANDSIMSEIRSDVVEFIF